LQEAGVNVTGFLDDNPILQHTEVSGIEVLGGMDVLPFLREAHGIEAVYCPIGYNKLRVKFLSQAKSLGYLTPSYVHSSVILSSDMVMGDGVYILPGSIIMPYTTIKDYVMISMGVNFAHHSVLDEGVFLSTGCNFGALIHAKKYAYCGI
jgi:NDP-sugar pyrophosphorylase family protein